MYKTNLPLILAHRGESSDAPENTLSAINLSWKRGADGVEIDVHLTRDNQIVVIHNSRTRIIYGKSLRIKSHSLEKLKSIDIGRKIGQRWIAEKIPTLQEVLSTVPADKYLFIEIKCGLEIIQHLKQVLNQTKLNPNQIKLIGFGLKKMTTIKKNFSDYEVFLNRRISIAKVILSQSYWDNLISNLKNFSLDGVNLSYTKSINIKMVEKFRSNNLKIFIWTVNTPKKVLHLINLGVDGFMSDCTGWIREKVTLK